MSEKIPIHCDRCGRGREVKPTANGAPRLPGGWKRHADSVWCDTCWRQNYILRAISIPLARPVGETWDELRPVLRQAWSDSTAASNIVVRELAKADIVRDASHKKIPAMPSIYLYPVVRQAVPSLDPQSATCIIQAVTGKYRATRYDAVWLCKSSIPSYRYPTPYPVHNQAWSVRLGENSEPLIDLRLGGARRTLELRGARKYDRYQFGPQLKAFRALLDGEAVPGELAIYEKRKQERATIMIKMVMWLPKSAKKDRVNTMVVQTCRDSLLRYQNEGSDDIGYIHADHAKGWIAEHRRKLQRISDDTKREKRIPKRMMRDINRARERWTGKMHRRMDSLVHEVSAQIANIADRRAVARVLYDDRDQSFAESFPYHELKGKLQYKLDEIGVELIHVTSDEVMTKLQDSLEQETE